MFRSAVWSCKFDKDTKAKKFGSLGYTNIPKGRVYKLGNYNVLKKNSSSENTNFQTKNFKDLDLDGKSWATTYYCSCLSIHVCMHVCIALDNYLNDKILMQLQE